MEDNNILVIVQNHILSTWPNECVPWLTSKTSFQGQSILPQFPWGQSYTITECKSMFLPPHVLLTFKNSYHDVIEIYGPYLNGDFQTDLWIWNKEPGAANSFQSPFCGKRLELNSFSNIEVTIQRTISWWDYLIINSQHKDQSIELLYWKLPVPISSLYHDQCPLTNHLQTKDKCACFLHFQTVHETSPPWSTICDTTDYIPDNVHIYPMNHKLQDNRNQEPEIHDSISSKHVFDNKQECQDLWNLIKQTDIVPSSYITQVKCDTPSGLETFEHLDNNNISRRKQTKDENETKRHGVIKGLVLCLIICVIVVLLKFVSYQYTSIPLQQKNSSASDGSKG